jgi:hypothetical protein
LNIAIPPLDDIKGEPKEGIKEAHPFLFYRDIETDELEDLINDAKYNI